MEIAHFAALSPEVDSLGARKARKCTVDIILPQHCYMGSICSGIAQYPHSHMEASLFFHIQTLALSVQDSYQRLRSGWISPAWEQIVSQVCQDCGNRNQRETWNNFGRGKSVLHNPAQLTTQCLWAYRDRKTAMLAKTKGPTSLILFWQWSATDAERRVKKETRQVVALLQNTLPASGLPKSEAFTLYFIVFD